MEIEGHAEDTVVGQLMWHAEEEVAKSFLEAVVDDAEERDIIVVHYGVCRASVGGIGQRPIVMDCLHVDKMLNISNFDNDFRLLFSFCLQRVRQLAWPDSAYWEFQLTCEMVELTTE